MVLALAEKGQMIDVTTVAAALAGATHFIGANADKGQKAYRVVAADVLGCMADCGALVQSGPWSNPKRPEDGGPAFTVPSSPTTRAA
jgi:hypothetical protein